MLANLTEVIDLSLVTSETDVNSTATIGTENGDLLTTTPGFLEGNATLSTTYPVRAVPEKRPNGADVTEDLRIFATIQIDDLAEFVDKVLPEDAGPGRSEPDLFRPLPDRKGGLQ